MAKVPKPTGPELRAARDAGRAAGKAGKEVTDCPYQPADPRQHIWLEWWVYEQLTNAGWPK